MCFTPKIAHTYWHTLSSCVGAHRNRYSSLVYAFWQLAGKAKPNMTRLNRLNSGGYVPKPGHMAPATVLGRVFLLLKGIGMVCPHRRLTYM